MSDFTFKKTKSIDIKDTEGNILKTYKINVGNHQTLKAWMSEIKKIEEMSSRMHEGEDVIDGVVEMEKKIVTMMTEDWDYLWNLCEENVFAMLDFVTHLSTYVKEEISAMTGKYL